MVEIGFLWREITELLFFYVKNETHFRVLSRMFRASYRRIDYVAEGERDGEFK